MMFRQLKVGERLQPFTGTTGQGQAAMLVIAVVDSHGMFGINLTDRRRLHTLQFTTGKDEA